MKLFAIALLASFIVASLAATCTYDQSANTVTCDSVTCRTVSQVSGGKLPVGYYRIGNFYHHGSARTPWFNLYKQRPAGGYWDYYTKIPDESCRGGFGLHPGTVSLGCITTTSPSCFDRLKTVILRSSVKSFTATECLWCGFRICWRGTSTVTRYYTTDLSVHP